MPWPDAVEFKSFLTLAGLLTDANVSLENLLDLEDLIAAAVERWNEATGYVPFLSTGDAQEIRTFPSPFPARILDLAPYQGGLVGFTSLTVGVTSTISSGTVYTTDYHFRLLPRDAAQRKKPWTQIEFLYSPGSPWDGEVDIKGEWGYCTEANLPRSVRRAVMAMAALDCLPLLQPQFASGLVRWTEGDVTKQFASPEQAKIGWQTLVDMGMAGIPERIAIG